MSARIPAAIVAFNCFCGMVLTASQGAAQGTVPAPVPTPVPTPPGVADTVTVLPEVKVDTPRQPVSDHDSQTRVDFDRKALRRFEPSYTADAIATAPGVELVKTGPWSSRLSMRGVSGERVLLTVDGVRMSTGRGHGAETSLVPFDDLRSVEVAPGSAGVAGGSDAVGGVVNLVTRGVLFSPAMRIDGTAAARGATPGGTLAPSARLRLAGPNAGIEFAGGLAKQDALVTPSGPLDPSGSEEEHWRVHLAGRVDAWRLDLERSVNDAHDIGMPAFGTSSNAYATYPLQARSSDRADLEWRAPSMPFIGHLRWSDQEFDSAFEEVTTDTIISPRTRLPIAYRTTTTNDDLGTDVRNALGEFRLGNTDSGTLRVEWRDEASDGAGTGQILVRNLDGSVASDVSAPRTTSPPATRHGIGTSLDGRRDFGLARVDAGVRFDRLRSEAEAVEDTVTGGSPAVDVVDERWSFELGAARTLGAFEPYARAATGFRAPGLDERFFDGIIHGGLRVFGNPELVSETSRTYELGLRYDHKGRERARVSAYRSDFDDFIELSYLGQLYLVPRFQYVNIAEARVEGVELELEARRGRYDFGVTAAAPRGVDRNTGQRLPSAGTTRVALDVRAAVPPPLAAIDELSVGTRARWSDAVPAEAAAVDESGEAGVAPFARSAAWAFAVESRARLGSTEISFAVRNLFDHTYREPLSFVDEPGRTFVLAVRHDFVLRGDAATPGSSAP